VTFITTRGLVCDVGCHVLGCSTICYPLGIGALFHTAESYANPREKADCSSPLGPVPPVSRNFRQFCGKLPAAPFMSAGAPIRRESSDEELVRGFRTSGDSEYFRVLFDRHKRRVYVACKVFLQDASAAEDATQEAFLRAFQNLDKFSGGNFVAWVMRIAKNVCIDVWRSRHRHPETGEEDLAAMSDGQSLENVAALRVAADRLRQELAKLPEQQRRCLELKIEGHSYEEMAALTGLPVAAVKSHLQNGRRTLWLQMEKVLG